MKRVVRKEEFPEERAGEEGIRSFECIQNKTRAGGLSASWIFLANSGDRCNLRVDLSAWGDLDGPAFNLGYASFDLTLVGLEPDVL